MARRRRKARTLKVTLGRARRDHNGKFVNASGTNRSKGYNVANLKQGHRATTSKAHARGSKVATVTMPTTTPQRPAQPKRSKATQLAYGAAFVGVQASSAYGQIQRERLWALRARHLRASAGGHSAYGYAVPIPFS